MSDLKQELESLRIDRDRPAAGRGRRVAVALLAIALAAAAAFLVVRRAGRAVEIVTTQPTVRTTAPGAPGLPVLTASGYVVPRRKAVVSAKIQGRLSDLRVEEGSRVRQGEVIARLESADYAASLASARASVERAEADLAEQRRQERLNQRLLQEKVVSQDAQDAADSRVRMAEAALSQAKAQQSVAEAQLANTVIRAPFDGVVLKKMAEVGESVAPIPPGVNISTASGAIVALADLDTLEVEADVSESNVARLQPDQPAEVSVEAVPDRRYKAVVRQVIPTADRTRATVLVKVTIVDKDPVLKPEMNAKVDFLEGGRTAAQASTAPTRTITVPSESVVDRDGHPVVFAVDDGRVRALAVVTGGTSDGRVVVRQGLSGAETLVLRPPERLRDGDAVRVKS